MQNGIYAIICLSQVVFELLKENRIRCIILHHDNASSHNAYRMKEFLDQKNIEIVTTLMISTLSPKYKKKIRSQRFSSPAKAVDAYKWPY